MGIKHSFVSGVTSSTDTARVRPTNWNADHTIDGDVNFNGNAITNCPSLIIPPGSGQQVDYYDIRDYGTVTSGGDIFAAFQATITANLSRPGIIRVPRVGLGEYDLLGALNWGGSANWVVELNCYKLHTDSTFYLPQGSTLRGLTHFGGGTVQQFPAGTFIIGDRGSHPNPVVANQTDRGNMLFENLQIYGESGVALKLTYSASMRVEKCVLASNTSSHAFEINQCFWVNCEDILLDTNGGSYSMKILSDAVVDAGAGIGILTFKRINMYDAGILIKTLYGSDNGGFTFEDILSEQIGNGRSLITLDATDNVLNNVVIRRVGNADPVGANYILKTVGSSNSTITVEQSELGGDVLDPASVNPNHLRLEPCISGANGGRFVRPGPTYWTNNCIQWPTAYDGRLIAAPRSPVAMLGNPVGTRQDPVDWTVGAATVTTGKRGPDGSLLAGEISGGGNPYTQVSGLNYAPSVGDWVILGCWVRSTSTSHNLEASAPIFSVDQWSGSVTGAALNGVLMSLDGNPRIGRTKGPSLMNDAGWVFMCEAFKVTALGTGNWQPFFRLPCVDNEVCQFFMPSMQLVPASLGYDDATVISYTRSLSNSWPCPFNPIESGTRTDVSILGHQHFVAGALRTPISATKTIASGAITVTGSYHRVDTEAAGATDDLDTISGGIDGQRLILRALSSARTVVVKDGTNLKLAGDFSLDNEEDTIELMYDGTLTKWLEIGRSDNGA